MTEGCHASVMQVECVSQRSLITLFHTLIFHAMDISTGRGIPCTDTCTSCKAQIVHVTVSMMTVITNVTVSMTTIILYRDHSVPTAFCRGGGGDGSLWCIAEGRRDLDFDRG